MKKELFSQWTFLGPGVHVATAEAGDHVHGAVAPMTAGNNLLRKIGYTSLKH